MNRQTGMEIHVNSFKYHIHQEPKADEHKANINITKP